MPIKYEGNTPDLIQKDPKYRTCSTCGGTGLITSSVPQHSEKQVTCSKCGGTGKVK